MSWWGSDDEWENSDEEARKAMLNHRHRLEVDIRYVPMTLGVTRHKFIKTPDEKFEAICRDLVAGLKIAVKEKDDDLAKRYWIADLLEELAGFGIPSPKEPATHFSIEESMKMAATFAPAIPLMNTWAAGREKYEKEIDFQTNRRPRTFAGEIDYDFLWAYNRLISDGHTPGTAAHPTIFAGVMAADGKTQEYVFRADRFRSLLWLCDVYRQSHTLRTDIDVLFETEMKKPEEERFFYLDDDEDEGFDSIETIEGCTERSRLKAYFRYRMQTLDLHQIVHGGRNGFDSVREGLEKRLDELRKGNLTPPPRMDWAQAKMPDWYSLLVNVMETQHWISYHEYGIDESEVDPDDSKYGEDNIGRYYEQSDYIPEYELCQDVRRLFKEYLELCAALAYYVRSSTYAALAEALEIHDKHQGWFVRIVDYHFGKDMYGKQLRKMVSLVQENLRQLSTDVRMFKLGRTLFANLDTRLKAVKEAVEQRTGELKSELGSKLESAQKVAEEVREQQNEALDVAKATNERVQTGVAMIRSLKKYNTVGKSFSFADQKLCFDFWVHDRVSPTLVHGRKVFYVDSFNAHKDLLAKNGVTDVGIFRKLIEDYIKRTGKKIPNTKRKLAAAKSESGNGKRKAQAGKRKTARGKRKSTPGMRKPK